MTNSDGAVRGERRARTLRRLAFALWLVLGFVIWNDVFDAICVQGGREYLTRQVLYRQGKGPAATIHGVMDEAVARGARVATLAGGSVAAAGVLAVWMAGRRRQPTLPGGPAA